MVRDFDALTRRTFDLVVVGGGVNGTGVARDAARRGLRVALVEQEDFGYGTTGRSTRLVHGGLRYLAMYDFALVRKSLRERERLLENAAHLVEWVEFLIPYYRGQRTPPWLLDLGLLLYDALAAGSRIPRHRRLTRDELLALEPGLSPMDLRGGAAYGDGQVALVERLCVENALDAVAHGAVVVNHARVESLAREEGFDTLRVRVRDGASGGAAHVRARRLVDTTGPWLGRLPGLQDVGSRTTKGVHLVTPRSTHRPVLLFSPDDDRVFFSIPWLDVQLVGTTDTDWSGDPDDVHANARDVAYLQRGIRRALPDALVDEVHYAYAGIRNLVPVAGRSESSISRRHQVIRHDDVPEAISLVGGKITPYRAVCEEIVDLVFPHAPRSDTARARLPGGPADVARLTREVEARCAAARVAPGAAHALVRTFGTRAHAVLDRVARAPAEAEVVCPHAPTLAAEVRFVVEHEMARTAADVLQRRLRTGWEPCEGLDALAFVLDALHGDDAAARAADESAYRALVATRHRHEGPSGGSEASKGAM